MATCAISTRDDFMLDDERTAISLQLEEIGIYTDGHKGKYAIESPPDSELAYQRFKAELDSYQSFLDDRRYAQSMAAALSEDSAVIAQMTAMDSQNQNDRRLAMRLGGNITTTGSGRGTTTSPILSKNAVAQLVKQMHGTNMSNVLSAISDTSTTEAGPSKTHADPDAKPDPDVHDSTTSTFTCSVCHEAHSVAVMIDLDCEHSYCQDCAKKLFIRATKDESLFPPRCCRKAIPSEMVTQHMSQVEIQAFELASVEFNTLDRVYCSFRPCGAFIPSTRIDVATSTATCGDCLTRTCSMCKAAAHERGDCPADDRDRQVRELGRRKGWQTCQRCKSLVALTIGCNHMTLVVMKTSHHLDQH